MPDTPMSLIDHLRELRSRVIRSLLAVMICAALSFSFVYEPAREILRAPLDALDPDTTNVFIRCNPLLTHLRPFVTGEGAPRKVDLFGMTLMETFVVKFKIALLFGFLLAAPFVLYQGWAFIAAGLTAGERRTALRFLPLSLLLFLLGVGFAYFIALPIAALFLLSVDPEIESMLRYSSYVSLVVGTVGLFGVAFQLPLVCMALARLGLVSAQALAKKRRAAIVCVFVVGALLTPPEPFSQCLLALPLIGLYELGVVLARTVER